MRSLLVDGWALRGTPEGVHRYLVSLLREAARTPGPFRWLAAYPAAFPAPTADATGRVGYLPVSVPRRMLRHRVWEQIVLPTVRARVPKAVYLSPSYTLPLLIPKPRVVMVHDISYEIEPAWFPPREAFLLQRLTRSAVARADLVVAASHVTAGDLARIYSLPAQRCLVLSPGIGEAFTPGDREASREAVAASLGVRSPYAVSVGAILNRRNLPALVREVALVMDRIRDFRMIVVGANRTNPSVDVQGLIERTGHAKRFRWLPRVDEDLLVHLYRGATAYVTMSLYEGFGFPAAEAMACGTPVIAARRGSLPEVVGDGGFLVDPDAEGEAAGILFDLIVGRVAPEEAARRAVASAARFRWGKTLAGLESAMGLLS